MAQLHRFAALVCLLFAASPFASAQVPASQTPATQNIATQQPVPAPTNLAIINGRPYVRPTAHEQFIDYLKDSYGLSALANTSLRTVYGQAITKPDGWGQDWPGFGQRFGSAAAVTAINGNVRYAMEQVFREDLRYYPCHGCSAKRKIENAVMAEFTARHDTNGHRHLTLTPLVADFSGPLFANSFWYPHKDPIQGLVATRTVAVARIAVHLGREFILERKHKDPKLPD